MYTYTLICKTTVWIFKQLNTCYILKAIIKTTLQLLHQCGSLIKGSFWNKPVGVKESCQHVHRLWM